MANMLAGPLTLFYWSFYGFEQTLSTQEHAGVQMIPLLVIEQDMHPKLALATQICGA